MSINVKPKLQNLLGLSSDSSHLRKHLTTSSIGTFILKISATFIGFVNSLILAHLLGAKGYGAYAYAISLVGLMNVLVSFGLPLLATREVSVYKTKSQWGLLKGFRKWSKKFVIANAAAISLTTLVISIAFREHLNHQMLVPFWAALILLPFMSLLQLKEATIQGLKHIIAGQISSTLIRSLLFFLFLILAYLFFKNLITPAKAVMLNAITTAIAFTVAIFMLSRVLPNPAKYTPPEYKVKYWLNSAVPLLLAGALGVINSQTDIIMLGAMKGAKPTGIYAAATKLASLIIFVLGSVNTAIAPTIAELYSKKDMKRLQNVITKSARAVFIFSLPIAIFLIFFGKYPLWLFGKEFMGGSKALAILSIGQLINASAGSVGLILVMTGHEKDVTIGVGISAVVNIILNATLIPFWGMEGAAIATSTSMIIWNGILGVMVYKKVGLNSTILRLGK